MPVAVVAKVETIDRISGGKLTSAFRYAHGYWDGYEREVRGFARVDRTDTETFGGYHSEGLHPDTDFEHVDPAFFSPPTLTRTWFHVGPVETDDEDVWEELNLSAEYWIGDVQLLGHSAHVGAILRRLRGATGQTDRAVLRDALRALRGSVLRTELFALDGSARAHRPYTVTEYAYTLREEAAPSEAGRPRVFLALPEAERVTEWERGEDRGPGSP